MVGIFGWCQRRMGEMGCVWESRCRACGKQKMVILHWPGDHTRHSGCIDRILMCLTITVRVQVQSCKALDVVGAVDGHGAAIGGAPPHLDRSPVASRTGGLAARGTSCLYWVSVRDEVPPCMTVETCQTGNPHSPLFPTRQAHLLIVRVQCLSLSLSLFLAFRSFLSSLFSLFLVSHCFTSITQNTVFTTVVFQHLLSRDKLGTRLDSPRSTRFPRTCTQEFPLTARAQVIDRPCNCASWCPPARFLFSFSGSNSSEAGHWHTPLCSKPPARALLVAHPEAPVLQTLLLVLLARHPLTSGGKFQNPLFLCNFLLFLDFRCLGTASILPCTTCR
ncbi:hypothetical protein LIA77_07084 [Sarocladium implicatum]|nr:hypothetical protein LIA77_07084 [Sarocladium implicatum]